MQIYVELVKRKRSLDIHKIPVIMTSLAPIAFAESRETSPMGPAPVMSTVEPRVTPARLHAWTPTDRGSSRAASSRVT